MNPLLMSSLRLPRGSYYETGSVQFFFGRERKTPNGRRFLGLYGRLERMSDNRMVTLNHAIASAMVHGPCPLMQAARLAPHVS